jgi:hypothetical protein
MSKIQTAFWTTDTARSRGGDPAMAALGEEVLKSLPLVTR